MIKKPHHTQAGFSLVETLVAITILMIVITGPMTISMATSRSTTFASEQVTAFFLAQEGAELAQKARDEILLSGLPGNNNWDEFRDADDSGVVYAECYESDGCGLELTEENITTIDCLPDSGGANICQLYMSASEQSRYTHNNNSGELALFTRTIKFTKVGDDDVQVVSTVTWHTGSLRKTQEVQVETHLFDVYK